MMEDAPMTFEMIPPTLDDMGYTLFGANWRAHFAQALNATEDDILIWETEPEKRPADLQDQIENLGLARIGEIQVMLTQMKATGLRA